MTHFHLEGDYPKSDPPTPEFIKHALLHQLQDYNITAPSIDLVELELDILSHLRYSVFRKWVDDITTVSAFLAESPTAGLDRLRMRRQSYPPTTYYFFFMYLLPSQKYLVLEFPSQREPTGSEIFSDLDYQVEVFSQSPNTTM